MPANLKAMQLIKDAGAMPQEGTEEWKKMKKDPIKFMDKVIENTQREVKYAQSGVEGHATKLEQIKEQEGKIQTLSNYAIKKANLQLSSVSGDHKLFTILNI